MICQNAGLFGACSVAAAARLEIHIAETGSISTIMLPIMEKKKKIVGYTYRPKEIPFGTLAHIVLGHATLLCYKKATVFEWISSLKYCCKIRHNDTLWL